MSAVLIPDWARVIERRHGAAIVSISNGEALLYVTAGGRQRMTPYRGATRKQAGRCALGDGAAFPDDVREICGLNDAGVAA